MQDDASVHTRDIREVDVSNQEWGSDFVADLLKAYGFDFVSFNPGASFRGIEESLVNYTEDVPEVIQTPHEGLTVSVAHGYAKATGLPAACILHDVVGTLHGAMSLYNAYVDRVPILALSGTGPLRKSKRRPRIDWIHSALDQAALVRPYLKWDDQPAHVDGVAESIVRAHRVADTPPKGPTYVTIDIDIGEAELDEPMEIPALEKFEPASKIAPDPDAIEAAADLLVDAELPVVIVDQIGDSQPAVEALVELAETLGAPVVDDAPHAKKRYNFPNTHPMDLSGTGVLSEADVVLALDVWSPNQRLKTLDADTWDKEDIVDEDCTLIDIGTHDLEISNLVVDYNQLREMDLPIHGHTELAVPALLEAVAERLDSNTDAQKRAEDRYERLSERHVEQRQEWEQMAADAWDETPVSVPRLAGEIWEVIQDEEWVIVNGQLREWAHRLWDIDEFDKYIGGLSGGHGVGYGVGAAIGGALAYAETDRIPINLQTDGDLMFYPNALWMMGHYELPIFNVMHNNQSLYNSTEHRMRLAEFRGRDDSFEKALIGTGYWDPIPNYAEIAEGMGVNGYGPVEDPDELPEVLAEAWEDVKNGEPVLVDVVCQAR